MSDKREKCFVMMPIGDQGDYLPGHFTKVYEQIIKPAIEDTGYEAYRVDENKISDAIMEKIFDAIQNCPMAVCDLSNRNPNVLYELGLRQAYDKPVVLIQDDKTESIFDVSGISTVFYNNLRLYENVMQARTEICKAILATKEGRNTSMAKTMKVRAADFSSIEVSADDKTKLMFSQIMNALSRIQENCQSLGENAGNNKYAEIRKMINLVHSKCNRLDERTKIKESDIEKLENLVREIQYEVIKKEFNVEDSWMFLTEIDRLEGRLQYLRENKEIVE